MLRRNKQGETHTHTHDLTITAEKPEIRIRNEMVPNSVEFQMNADSFVKH